MKQSDALKLPPPDQARVMHAETLVNVPHVLEADVGRRASGKWCYSYGAMIEGQYLSRSFTGQAASREEAIAELKNSLRESIAEIIEGIANVECELVKIK